MEAQKFSQAVPQSRLLFEFSLAGNHIGNKGVIAIVRALAQTRTKFLELMNNQIGDRGAIALAKAFLSAVRRRLVCPALVSFLPGRIFFIHWRHVPLPGAKKNSMGIIG